MDIKDYLILVGENFDRFDIQRPKQSYQPYDRMKNDIMDGALLPAITLSINPERVEELLGLFLNRDVSALKKELPDKESIFILDGLQRTYILKEISKIQDFSFKKDQTLLLEFWLEKEIKHLIYRLIVLNAGQKPMSMRHQIELLFMTMQDKIQKQIPGLKLISERDEEKRKNSKEFPFDRVVSSYNSYINKSALNRRENIVVEQLNEMEILNSDEYALNETYESFIHYFQFYTQMDEFVYNLYQDFQKIKVRSPKNWLVEETTMSAFFAAISQFGTDEKRKKRVEETLEKLLVTLKKAKPQEDILGLVTLSDIREGINPKRVNVGVETRKILTNGFKEYFREEGQMNFGECWKQGAN